VAGCSDVFGPSLGSGLRLAISYVAGRVIKVFKDYLRLDRRFDVDFNTAFVSGSARPHGLAVK